MSCILRTQVLLRQIGHRTAGPGDGISLSSVRLNCEILVHNGDRVPAGPPTASALVWRGLFRVEPQYYN